MEPVEPVEPTPSPPAAVLEAAGLRPEGLTLIPWRHRLWTATLGDRPAVLHRYPAWRPPADVAWEHAFLRRLAATGFPAPRPLGAFGGESWLAAAGAVWGLVSFLPGRTLEWAPRPGLEAVGALLARYHDAAAGVPVAAPGPRASRWRGWRRRPAPSPRPGSGRRSAGPRGRAGSVSTWSACSTSWTRSGTPPRPAWSSTATRPPATWSSTGPRRRSPA